MSEENTMRAREAPLDLEWIEVEDSLILAEGGEGVRFWSDDVSFYQAEVPGGVLVMAVREQGPGGLAMAFVPTITPHDVAARQRTLDALMEMG